MYKTIDRYPMVEAARRLYEQDKVPFSAILDAWGFAFTENRMQQTRVRTFRLQRNEDVSGVSGTGVVAVGAQFPTGRVIIEWLPGKIDVRSFNIYDSLADLEATNGHENRTVVVWDE